MEDFKLRVIARIHTDFTEKFGIPRQSGLAQTKGTIVFEPSYRCSDAVRGLEKYSHIWLLWGFSANDREETFHATVRPPRLGGNERVGVFATRSPFRPNPIGLSCVKLETIMIEEERGPVLHVEGADLLDGTPIYDIKPYLPYVDVHPEATGSFAEEKKNYALEVVIPEELKGMIPATDQEVLVQILSQDPRPAYQKDPDRIYGMSYAGMEIRFRVEGMKLNILEIAKVQDLFCVYL